VAFHRGSPRCAICTGLSRSIAVGRGNASEKGIPEDRASFWMDSGIKRHEHRKRRLWLPDSCRNSGGHLTYPAAGCDWRLHRQILATSAIPIRTGRSPSGRSSSTARGAEANPIRTRRPICECQDLGQHDKLAAALLTCAPFLITSSLDSHDCPLNLSGVLQGEATRICPTEPAAPRSWDCLAPHS
jgi:hypothetical protein